MQSQTSPSFCAHCGAALIPGAKFCPSCGSPVAAVVSSDAAPFSAPEPSAPTSFLKQEIVPDADMKAGFLTLVMWLGFGGAAFFLLFFDPTVATAAGRVNNIGLMQDRQNYMLFCGGVGVVALIIKLVSKPDKNSSATRPQAAPQPSKPKRIGWKAFWLGKEPWK